MKRQHVACAYVGIAASYFNENNLIIDLIFRFLVWISSGTFIWCCPSWAVKRTICSEVHTKHVNTLCGQNFAFVRVKPGGTLSNHWAATTDTTIALQFQFLIATMTDGSLFCCSTSSRKLHSISTPQSPQLEHQWRLPELKVRTGHNLCDEKLRMLQLRLWRIRKTN
jgi:hypothetical protein